MVGFHTIFSVFLMILFDLLVLPCVHKWEFKTSQCITNCRAEPSQNTELGDEMSSLVTSPRTPSQSQKTKPGIFVMFEGLWLIMRSPYLIYISLFLWLSAVVSSFFYFQVWLFSFRVWHGWSVVQCCEHVASFNKLLEYKGSSIYSPNLFSLISRK